MSVNKDMFLDVPPPPNDEDYIAHTSGLARQGAAPRVRPVRHAVPTPTVSTVKGFEWTAASHSRDIVEPMMARYELAAKFPGAIYQPTGIKELDDVVPFAPGRLVVIAGRQGAGKSALAIQIARYVATAGPVLYALTEMSREEVITRAVANTGHLDAWKLDKGATPETLAAAKKALRWISENTDMTFVEVTKAPLQKLLDSIRTWHAANPEARMIVVDNLWGIAFASGLAKRSTSELSVALGDVAKAFADLAIELKLPVILVHHEGRSAAPSAKGEQTVPDASQLGGSDHIGNWASTVLQLRSKPQLTGELLNGCVAGDATHDAFVTKNRGSRSGVKIGLRFIGAQLRFEGSTAATPFDTAPATTETDKTYRSALAQLPEW